MLSRPAHALQPGWPRVHWARTSAKSSAPFLHASRPPDVNLHEGLVSDPPNLQVVTTWLLSMELLSTSIWHDMAVDRVLAHSHKPCARHLKE